MNKEIIGLKVFSGNDYRGLYVSKNAADWKEVLDEELSSLESQDPKAGRKPSSRKICTLETEQCDVTLEADAKEINQFYLLRRDKNNRQSRD